MNDRIISKFIFLLLITFFSGNILSGQKYSINRIGTELYEITNKAFPDLVLSVSIDSVRIEDKNQALWRKTNLDDGFFILDFISQPEDKRRLLASSYAKARVTKTGIESQNDDVKWKLIPTNQSGWFFLMHKTSGKYLSTKGNVCGLVDSENSGEAAKWKFNRKKIDLNAIESPILMMGNDKTGFRDPAVLYYEGIFYMYYSLVLTEEDEKIYWYVAYSKSTDLIRWTDPVIITPKDQFKNFGSPGNVIRFNNEWVLCMQTYVMPGFTRKDPLRTGNKDCRIWITRSKDLENWNEPELLKVKGDIENPGRMIDAYLIEDKDNKGKWWCFYKQDGASYSYSYDLKKWTFFGRVNSGENVCVWVENDTYYMMNSPKNGMNILKSNDLKDWKVYKSDILLGQKEWWNWAGQRVTAGFVLDLRDNPLIGKYLLFFHGQGPAPKTTEVIDSGTDLGIAWSDDLIHWEWPAKK